MVDKPTGTSNHPLDVSDAETVAGPTAIFSPWPAAPDAPPHGTNPQTWRVLRHCGAFTTLSSSAIRDILAAATERSFQAGEALMTQGNPAEGLLILLEGTAHARLRGPAGEDRCIGRFAGGDLVGEMALVTREPRSATVLADSPVRALLLPTPVFDRLAARHLELGMLLTRLVAERLGQGAHDGFGGKQVDGFRILRCIGRGGMSVVYRAQEESTGDLVALKMMSYRLIYDADALARFHQEAAILQGLHHENIAHLRRLFPAYHTYFLVMELCEGVDLQRLVSSRGRLTEAQVRPILGQLASALEYVHQRGLVHRDLKPGNVMITMQGQVKLTDFGLAVPVVAPGDHTGAAIHVVMGTPVYMAPEQLCGGPLDRRTDVYALGCLAYDLLTGRRLFTARSASELVQQKRTLQLPRAAEIGDGISEELYGFLESALRVSPDDRPASAASLLPWAARCTPPPQDLIDEIEATGSV